MKTINIQLIQGEQKLSFSTDIEAQAITVISGTLALRIISLFRKVKKYKMNLGGFSFSRKFDVQLTIDGKQLSGTEVVNGVVRFGITLHETENSIELFGCFINELVEEILTGVGELEINLDELLEETNALN